MIMKIIPIAYFLKRKLYSEREKFQISLSDLLSKIKKDSDIYIYDFDGINRNKPNLCSYPKISVQNILWVDNSPRNLGDVVDAVLAGAANITIRRDLWPKVNISNIREISEGAIYEFVDLEKINRQKDVFYSDADGIIISSQKNNVGNGFIVDDLIKNICRKFKVYVIESDISFFSYWKKIGVKGILIDFNKYLKVGEDEL